jgi:predicted CXXCH cytochrome family protein
LQQRVFQGAGFFSDKMRCAECHREHKAPTPLVRQDNAKCVDCHGDIKAFDPQTSLTDIHDFDRDHPGFKLTLRTGAGEADIERIPQTEKARLVEKSGLKFPHNQHFGLVQGPGGMSDIRELACTSCHRPEGKEMRFKPLSFKRDCLDCHADRLEVGPAGARLRLPHGAEENVLNALKVNAPKQVVRYSEMLKTDGCAYCHEVEATGRGDPLSWRVMPLRITLDWFSKARFNHALHRIQKCQSCHQVEDSERSSDIAIPDRKSCLKCHAGNSPKHRRITSSCMSCHEFHNAHAVKDRAKKPYAKQFIAD